MQIHTWPEFKMRFNNYIRNTIGLFTLLEDTSFIHFDLDRFLDRQVTEGTNNSITQVEMLMSLSTFIDIEEGNGNLTSAALTARAMIQFNYLIDRRFLEIHPFSQIKKDCKPVSLVIISTGAAAAAA